MRNFHAEPEPPARSVDDWDQVSEQEVGWFNKQNVTKVVYHRFQIL